jgi:predicted nucleotidyltransferase
LAASLTSSLYFLAQIPNNEAVGFVTFYRALKMIADIADKRAEIAALCERHGVIRLGVFGSAARGSDFDPKKSDLDFLVLLDDRKVPDYLHRYFGLTNDLAALLSHPIDLVTEREIKSPIFRNAVFRDLESIYVRAGHEAAA